MTLTAPPQPRLAIGLAALLAVLAPLLPTAARAQSSTQLGNQQEPQQAALSAGDFTIGGSLDTELNLDRLGRRGGRSAYSDLYNKTELGLYLNMPAGFTLNGVFKLEPAEREVDGSDRAFNAHAAWVDQLYLSWAQGPLQLFAGKIHPRFGMAWDNAPGLYGTDFAEGYELSEKIGAGINLSLSDLAGLTDSIGDHSLQLEMFQADRTALSSSLFSRRWGATQPDGSPRYTARNRRSYGGADNTRGYQNLVASLAGNGVPMPVGSLEYTLGYSSRRAGLDTTEAGTGATERGYVGGVAWEFALPWRITATPMVEWLRQENADGLRNLRREVVTAGAEFSRRPFSVAYAYEWLKETGAAEAQAAMHTASVTYELGQAVSWLDGVDWTVGWRRLREDGISANDYGTQLTYSIRF